MKDYSRQFDEAHEVLEMTQSPGFATLRADIDKQIARIDEDIKLLNEQIIQEAGSVDAHKCIQQLIKLQSRKEGLSYIINQVAFYQKKKSEAIKRI